MNITTGIITTNTIVDITKPPHNTNGEAMLAYIDSMAFLFDTGPVDIRHRIPFSVHSQSLSKPWDITVQAQAQKS